MSKGFDIVIGNPPYIRQERINDMANGMDYKSMLAEIFAEEVKTEQNPDNKLGNTMDFSMYFIVRSRQILHEGGYNSFIITKEWLRVSYGEPIRQFLKYKTELKKFIEFVNIKVFQGITVDTIVYVLCNSDCINGKISFCCPQSMEAFQENDHDYYYDQPLLDDKVWSFSDPLTEDIKQWIKLYGISIKDLNVNINEGIKTGFNDPFLIKTETRNKLIELHPELDENIKPLINGKDLHRYDIRWDDWWLILFKMGHSKQIGINNEDEFKSTFPALYDHFESFFDVKGKGKGLKQRDDQGDFWWELRACAYYDELNRFKLIWQRITQGTTFSYDCNGLYPLNSVGFIAGESQLLKFLILLSNSKIIDNFYLKEFVKKYGNSGYAFTRFYVSEIKIPTIDSDSIYYIADYLSFKNSNYLNEISNFISYDIYFHTKFHEDGLYPDDEMYLLNAVKPHLKPIEYEEWSELDWKRQLEEITDAESEQLEELTEENDKIIEEVAESLKNDEEVKKWKDIIKSHKWVKKIEGKLE